MKISEDKKRRGVECCAYACKSKPVAKLGGLCNKHYRRKRREIDPVGVRYNQFKSNAVINRNKDFTVTLEEFRFFCDRNGYIIKKGRRGYNATIDRRCNAQGYHIWNMQLMEHRANCRKGTSFNNNFEAPEVGLPF